MTSARLGVANILPYGFVVRTSSPNNRTLGMNPSDTQFDGVVTSTGGKVQKAEKWGRRRLAYEVKRCREGMYLLFTIECDPPTVREFERRLKVTDQVVKFLTVRVDEDYATTRPGVFAGGDNVNGADLVVTAMADGRRASEAIHRYLESL